MIERSAATSTAYTRRPIYICGGLTALGVLLAAGYSVLSILDMVAMNRSIFFEWLGVLMALNTLLLFLFWQRRNLFGVEVHVFMVLWLGVAFWYWSFAPIYFFLTVSLNVLQLKWVAFAYFWEVPIVGGLFVACCLRLFTQLKNFMASSKGEWDLEVLYTLTLRYPILVAFLIFLFTVGGYIIGSAQFWFFGFMPVIEVVKGVLNGFIISSFLAIFYYLFFDIYLERVRARIEAIGPIDPVARRSFYRRVFGVILVISITNLAAVNLLFFQGFQLIIKERLIAGLKRDMARVEEQLAIARTVTAREDALATLKREGGQSASFYLESQNDPALSQFSPETQVFIRGYDSGVAEDYQHDLKIIAFAKDAPDGRKFVSVLYAADSYTQFENFAGFVAFAEFFILLLAVGITTFTSVAITRALRVLARSVRTMEVGDSDFEIVHVNTGDELEELSHAFSRYIAESKDLRTKLEEKTSALSRGMQELDDSQKAMLNILEDLKNEKNIAEEARAKDDALLLSMAEGVIATDPQTKITFVNQQAELMLGYSAKELIGRHFFDVITAHDESGKAIPKEERALASALRTGRKVITSDHYYTRKDGTKFPVTASAAPIKNAKLEGGITVIRDITEERRIDRAKSEFVSLASHQLRTPLTITNWYAERLLKGRVGTFDRKQKEYLKEIAAANQRMVALVNALLNVSRIELGTFIVEPELLDLKVVAKEALSELSNEIKKKKIKMELTYGDDLPKVQADPKIAHIVFQNLLSNAIKYSPPGSPIELSVTREGEEIVAHVKDRGCGIPRSQQSKIFTKLFRADNAREMDPDGSGLGLYIIKSALEWSGGRVWFESEEGKGSTFFAAVPVSGMKRKVGEKKLDVSSPVAS